MRYICSMMGAALVIVAEPKSRSRKATSVTPDAISEIPHDHTSIDVDYIIVSDVTPEDTIDKDLASKTCNVEWVKQCLVCIEKYSQCACRSSSFLMLDHGQTIRTVTHGQVACQGRGPLTRLMSCQSFSLWSTACK